MIKARATGSKKDFFFKSIVVAIAVSVLTLLFQLSPANLLLFSCLGASAVLLVNQRRYSKTTLRIVLEAYIFTGLIALGVLYVSKYVEMQFPMMVFVTMFLASFVSYLSDSIHPPAIGSALAFLIFERSILELGLLLVAIMILLVIIRFSLYIYHEHITIKHFWKEFISHRKKN